jgi:subtilisin family serine protease
MQRTAQALVAALVLASLGLTSAGSPAEHPPGDLSLTSQEAVRPLDAAVPDEILVKIRPGGTPARHLLDKLVGAEEVDRLEALSVVRLRLGSGVPVRVAAHLYESLPFVEYAEPNYVLRTVGVPDDPLYGPNQRWYYQLIEAPAAWDLGSGAQPSVVAVLDTGIDINHPDLAGKIWVNQAEIANNGLDDDGNGCIDDIHGCNFVDPETADLACVSRPSGPSSDVTDDDGHGTFVAGIVAARTNNGQGVAGTADGVVVMPVKVLACTGGGTATDIAAGISYAARNGARVINMSFGAHLESDTIRDAIKAAHDEFGVVLVSASGNSDMGEVSFPADLPEVIAVGASDHRKPDERAPFSDWGPEIDVAAPGVDITSTVPSKLCGRNWQCISSLPYSQASGTSFAAPLVSGLAGLLLSRNPGLSNEDVRTIIRSTAQPLPDRGSPNWAGAGRIRMKQALEFNLEERPTGGLSPGCNMVTLTFASGTGAAALTTAVSPAEALDTVWRLDNATRSFQAFMPQAPQASDLTSLNLLDAAFICVDAAATIAMPAVASDPAGAPISVNLSTGCNAVGLSFADGSEPSDVASAMTPAGALESIWRLDNATHAFQAYVAAAPQASDLTSLQFLDAVFICTGGPATLSLPAVLPAG